MLGVRLHSDREEIWRDAARRLHRATFGGEAIGAEVFDGAARAKPQAMLQALAAGRHVIVVAEPCLTREELDSLAATAAKKKLTFAAVNPDRFLPSRQLIKKQLGGPLGSPELVRIHRWEPHASVETTSPLGLPDPLVAEIEQALWLVGRPVCMAFATELAAEAGRFLQVHLNFGAGMALIDYDDRLPDGAGYRSLSVIGSSGSAQIDDQANAQLAYRGGAPRGMPVGEGVRYLATLVDDFAAAVADKRDTANEVAAWRNVSAAVDAVRKSLTTRDAVTLEAR
jgi:predicted dehydrogenase